jgi:formamidopyrimidine-DNA glycosylase
MPELPEVAALAGFLSEMATGRFVARIDVAAISVLKTYEPPVTALQGLSITGVGRHGKFLDVTVGGLHLVTHLARAGWIRWHDSVPTKPVAPGRSPLALRVFLDDGSGFDLTEAGTRKRLAVYVVADVAEIPGVARLGPDPLGQDFTPVILAEILGGSRQRIKGLLRDQSVIAGIGNAYSDEVLHAARMSPFKIAGTLSDGEMVMLHQVIVGTLREAVDRSRGLAAASLKAEKKLGLRVHGRAGELCPVCADQIREVSFADSALQYCPTCQTGGRPLADRRLSRLLK